MAPEKNGRVVFIGNIPYGALILPNEVLRACVSEEQITDIFSRIGQVIHFRLVHDKETGRPKGFGFLEYTDPDAAASAVRNLNNFELQGRTLKVDWSNDDGPPKEHQTTSSTAGAHGGQNGTVGGAVGGGMDVAGGGAAGAGLPPLPAGADPQPGLTAPDAISKTLSTLPAPQLLDIISQMKGLVQQDPGKATELLRQAPQLSYAIFQALLLLGLVDTSVLTQIVETGGTQLVQAAPPPQQAPYQQLPPQHLQPPYQQPPQQVPQPYGTPQQHQVYPGYPPQPQLQQFQQPQHVATPPVQQAYAPPPQPANSLDQQQELLRQVMALTRQQIDAMPMDQRNQIIALRTQLGAPVM
ncbi:hypothetical protein LTR66_002039 [Elasticomyces elasticus]|nr:hypothetical protein LTR66_002039 [Elasticomyces elasticus]